MRQHLTFTLFMLTFASLMFADPFEWMVASVLAASVLAASVLAASVLAASVLAASLPRAVSLLFPLHLPCASQ